MTSNQNHQFLLLPKIVNGGIAGIIGVAAIFPLDLVKTRLQSQIISPNGEKQYNSILDCFKKTYRTEGYFAMYKGSAVNILLIAPEKGIKLAANDLFRHYLTSSNGELSLARSMAAGGLAGLCQITVTTPMELLKIQMQTAVAGRAKQAGEVLQNTSAISITLGLLKTEGLKGLYKGYCATALRDVSFSVIYFPLYAHLSSLDPRKRSSLDGVPFYWSFLSGCGSASISALAVTPFDVIKTRLQVKKGEGALQYSGVWDAISRTFKHEGPIAFFKGGACRVMVLAPLFGIAQMVYYLGVAEYILGLK